MTTDRTISAKHAHEVFLGNVIVRDPETGDYGRWAVTATRPHSPYVRVDARDEETHRSVVWFPRGGDTVVVEMCGREMQLRAAETLTILMSEDLPGVYSWELGEDGLCGMIRFAAADTARANLDIWRQRLGGEAAALDEEPTSDRSAKLTVSGALDGVPVKVWASVQTGPPKSAASTSKDEGQAAAADKQDAEATA